jgi:hypothetical protein
MRKKKIFLVLIFALIAIFYFAQTRITRAVWVNMDYSVSDIEDVSSNAGISRYPQIALDSSQNPYLVWQDTTAGNGDIFFTKWTPGTGWTKMNGTLGYDNLSDNTNISRNPQIAIDSNDVPYVIWEDQVSSLYQVIFTKWTSGTGWTQMDETLGYEQLSTASLSSTSSSMIKLDNSNVPYVFWSELRDLYISKWTVGIGWTNMDGVTGGDENITNTYPAYTTTPDFVLDSESSPYIVWDGSNPYALKFTKWTPGTGWTNMDGVTGGDEILNSSISTSKIPKIELDSANNPYIVWSEVISPGTHLDIYFIKWTPGTGWTGMDEVLGGEDISGNSAYANNPKIKLDSDNNPYIVWDDTATGSGDIYVTKWTLGAGTGVCGATNDCWTDIVGTTSGYENIADYSTGSAYPEMILDSAGNPNVIWKDYIIGKFDLIFSRWVPETGWTEMDGETLGYENISNNTGTTYSHDFVLNNVNFPYVVWDDDYDGDFDTYFTRWDNLQDNEVDITAYVEPSLSVSFPSGLSADLGEFSSTTIQIESYQTLVSTNGSAGYTAYIKDNGNLANSAADEINDVSGGTVESGTSEYGIATTENDSVDIIKIQDANTDTEYTEADCRFLHGGTTAVNSSALTETYQSYAMSTGPVDNDSVYLCFSVAISSDTPAGNYDSTATIIVTGNF